MKNILSILLLIFMAVTQAPCGGSGGGGGSGGITPAASATPQEVISSFRNATTEQDIDKMADNFHPSNRDAYKTDFQTAQVAGVLTKLAEALQTAQEVYTKKDYAKYKVQVTENGEVITFYIYLIKDANGNWKIWSI